MRYLVLSDLHANLQALEAVLEDAERAEYEQVLLLGDIVGYGGDPSAVLARALALPIAAVVRGNHDKVCAGLEAANTFGGVARDAIDWTRTALSREELSTLAGLPTGPRSVDDGLAICHGAPFDEDHYIFGRADARRALHATPARLCLFGHTHVPAAFTTDGDELAPVPAAAVLPLGGSVRYLVNPGSVGQPRDGDPRAAYGVLDTSVGTLQFERVVYDVAGAQAQIRRMGLPPSLADRLTYGR